MHSIASQYYCLNMFRNIIISLLAAITLLACAGGMNGTMSSAAVGYWQVYKVDYQASSFNDSQYSVEMLIEDLFFKLGFEDNGHWHSPLLNYSRVTTFKQAYKDRYINVIVEVAEEQIIVMSTSYSVLTEKVFNSIEAELNSLFGKMNVAQCYGIKDIYGHSCFKGDAAGANITKLFSIVFGPSRFNE